MANKMFDKDPFMVQLRKDHPKQGPNPRPGESMEHWAERYMVYVREKHKEVLKRG